MEIIRDAKGWIIRIQVFARRIIFRSVEINYSVIPPLKKFKAQTLHLTFSLENKLVIKTRFCLLSYS